jgi:hypothetical protein
MELVTSIFTDSIFNLTPFISDYINCLVIQSKDKNKMTDVISKVLFAIEITIFTILHVPI